MRVGIDLGIRLYDYQNERKGHINTCQAEMRNDENERIAELGGERGNEDWLTTKTGIWIIICLEMGLKV